MGILDEAIKEHLELKRQHGAGESELQQLEDEAFGAAERPGDEPAADALSEAPTAYMAQPDMPAVEAAEGNSPKRRPDPHIADLQEPPEQEAPSAGHSTEERHAIAEQPTEMYDVEEEIASQEREAPSEDELVEEEMNEPRLAPVDPLADMEKAGDAPAVEAVGAGEEGDADLDEEFWDEKRLSDELDQALEAPPEAEAEPEAAEPAAAEESEGPEEAGDECQGQPRDREEDVLGETPDFLEEAPEDDQLWFEQKPPKDFDFDD
jgi:hypothetical protein